MKKILCFILFMALMVSNADAFTIFYEPIANKSGLYKIIYMLPAVSDKAVNVASFEEKSVEEITLMNCILDWNIKRKIDRFYIQIDKDGIKSIIENPDFYISMPYKETLSICKPATETKPTTTAENDKVAITVNEASLAPVPATDDALWFIQQMYKSDSIKYAFGWLRLALTDKSNAELWKQLKDDMAKNDYSKAIINMFDALINTTVISECPPQANKENCEKLGCKDCPKDEF